MGWGGGKSRGWAKGRQNRLGVYGESPRAGQLGEGNGAGSLGQIWPPVPGPVNLPRAAWIWASSFTGADSKASLGGCHLLQAKGNASSSWPQTKVSWPCSSMGEHWAA